MRIFWVLFFILFTITGLYSQTETNISPIEKSNQSVIQQIETNNKGTNSPVIQSREDENKPVLLGSISGQIITPEGWVYPNTYTIITKGIKKEADNGYFKYKNLLPGIYSIRVLVKNTATDKDTGESIGCNFILKNIRVNSGSNVDLGPINPEKNINLVFGKPATGEELIHYRKLAEIYNHQKKERAEKYKAELEKNEPYFNIFSSDTHYPLFTEAFFRFPLPGFSQFYNKRIIRGLIYLNAEIIALSNYFIFKNKADNYNDKYYRLENIRSIDSSIPANPGLLDRALINKKYSDTASLFALTIPLLSLIDGAIDTLITRSGIEQNLEIESKMNNGSINLCLSYSF